MFLLLSLIACQVMDQPGHAFSPVEIVEAATIDAPSKDEASNDAEAELFEDPQEDLIVMGTDVPSDSESSSDSSSEELHGGDVDAQLPSEPTPTATPVAAPVASAVATVSSSWKRATVRDGWKPTLVGTVMDGPSPHAILQMPSGDKVVVQAGDMLADDGVIVMTIGSNFVDLAVVNGLEGRASIQNITLTSQY